MSLVRAVDALDVPAVLALNNEHHVELSLLDDARLRALLGVAARARAVGPVGRPEAFLVAFDHQTPVQGPNHAWFLARLPAFLYVDRVCVSPRARRRGTARALYDDALAYAAGRGIPTLCCEVNSEPPNLLSDAFHVRLGFHEVARAYLPDRDKTVRYLEREVSSLRIARPT